MACFIVHANQAGPKGSTPIVYIVNAADAGAAITAACAAADVQFPKIRGEITLNAATAVVAGTSPAIYGRSLRFPGQSGTFSVRSRPGVICPPAGP